jgi:hypothetical protein
LNLYRALHKLFEVKTSGAGTTVMVFSLIFCTPVSDVSAAGT